MRIIQFFKTSGFILLVLLLLLIPLQAAFSDTVDENQESTVLVTCGDLNGAFGMGTGFVIGGGEFVVTNHHVIATSEQGDPVNIVLSLNEIIPGRVIWSSPVKDLAVIQTDKNLNRPEVTFTRADDVKVTDTVLVMGFPGAALDQRLIDQSTITTVKVSKGIISAKVFSKEGVALYQTDAPINPGNSGGPLFSEWGSVIGINSAASLVAGVVYDETGQQKTDRIRLGDNIGWSIQVDELLVELDALGISYEVEGRKQVSSGSGGGSNQFMSTITLILVIIAVLLAGGALVLAFTKKGRVVVKEVSRRIVPGQQKSTPINKSIGPPIQNRISSNTLTKPYLIGVCGQYAGQKFPLTQSISLGRNPSNNQIIFTVSEVSSNHCTVSFDQATNMFILTDLGSTNGTYLEGGNKLAPNARTPIRANQKFYLSNQNQLFQVVLES